MEVGELMSVSGVATGDWRLAIGDMALWQLVLVACVAAATAGKHDIYKGHSLYEVSFTTEEQLLAFRDLEAALDLDTWDKLTPTTPGRVLVTPEQKELFLQGLKDAGIEHAPDVQDVVELLEEEDRWIAEANEATRDSDGGRLVNNRFFRYAEVNNYMTQLANQFPNLVQVVTAGRSIQGRDIRYLRISTTGFQDNRKPIVMMESLLHAREWATLSVTLHVIEKLVTDNTERDLIQNIDWIIVPIANPDGYEFSHTNQRLWRKNRSTVSSTSCPGVDLNRNFNISWSSASSNNVCSETFHGRSAYSEPETNAIASIIRRYANRIELYLDIHSFGSYILYGWGHDGSLPANALNLHVAAVEMAQAIDANKYPANINYIVGNTFHTLYAASGGNSDYAQSQGVPLSYTYELPQFYRTGFQMNAQYIPQVTRETWEGIKAGARRARLSYMSRVKV